MRRMVKKLREKVGGRMKQEKENEENEDEKEELWNKETN